MKRNLCFLVILLIYLTSCQDDKGRDLNGISENLKSNAVLRATNEVLIFDSWDEYENAIDELDNQIEVADNAFLSQFGHLDDDSLNIIEDSIGYELDQPLIDLEIALSFYSLRKELSDLEDAWLATQSYQPLNFSEDPDTHFIIDDTERALHNINSQVVIDDTLYTWFNKGVVYQVYGLSQNTTHTIGSITIGAGDLLSSQEHNFNSFSEAESSLSGTPGIFMVAAENCDGQFGGPAITCCLRTSERKWVFIEEQGTIQPDRFAMKIVHKVKGPLGNSNIPNRSKLKAKTKSYEWRGDKYRKWRTNIYAGFNGYSKCGEAYINEGTSKRRRKVKHKIRISPIFTGGIIVNQPFSFWKEDPVQGPGQPLLNSVHRQKNSIENPWEVFYKYSTD